MSAHFRNGTARQSKQSRVILNATACQPVILWKTQPEQGRNYDPKNCS
jgi:hypothetical protein